MTRDEIIGRMVRGMEASPAGASFDTPTLRELASAGLDYSAVLPLIPVPSDAASECPVDPGDSE